MKKFNNILLSFIILLSCILPFIPYNARAMVTSFTYAYIDATDLSVRSCPSTDCSRIVHDEGGTICLYRPRAVEVIGQSGSWSQIKFNYYGFTYTGYVLTEYLGNKQTVTLDQNFANNLRLKGFPESYVESLTKLHAIHPKWNFELSNTGVSLSEAVEGEYNPIYKNLISTTNKEQLSTDPGAYNGDYIQFEPNWYAPNKETLKYYLDPRNFLDDNSIFMFEQLSYTDLVSEADVQAMLDGSFMAGSFIYNGETYTYARAFMEAGRNNNVNPIHLAARVLQEQGTNGSATTDMDGGDGQVYHNYFNFNASGSTVEEIVSNALSYAKSSGWNNPYTAINGGASEISDGYISNGQDTLYYQKFNTAGGNRYWHQYMANIQAPYKESYSSYSSYFRSNLLNNSYTFKIPVYTDMGIGSAIPTKSNNNNLNSLTISNVTLNPAFNASITTYNATVDYDISSVNINASKAHDKATINGLGTKELKVGLNEINIEVVAEDGSKKTYSIKITRKEEEKIDPSSATPDTIINSMKYKNDADSISGFTLGQNISDIKNNINSKASGIETKMYDSKGNEIESGLIATGQKIKVTINGKSKTYTVVIFGDTSGDGKISTIDYSKVKAHILKTKILEGAYYKAADISKDNRISTIDYSKIKAHIQKVKYINQ